MTPDIKPTCTADDEGRRCNREAVMLHPVALCQPHRIEIALTVMPELLRDQLSAALRAATAPAPRTDLVATASAAKVEDLLSGVHDSVVYFVANGGRVKIGYTTNLRSRLSSLALRSDSVLLALHGGPELERALHTHFADYRNGNTEWFDFAPEVFHYISASHPTATAVATARNGAALLQQPERCDGLSTAEAVMRLHAEDPNLPAAEIAKQLAEHGVNTTAAYVRTVRSRKAKAAETGRGFYP